MGALHGLSTPQLFASFKQKGGAAYCRLFRVHLAMRILIPHFKQNEALQLGSDVRRLLGPGLTECSQNRCNRPSLGCTACLSSASEFC